MRNVRVPAALTLIVGAGLAMSLTIAAGGAACAYAYATLAEAAAYLRLPAAMLEHHAVRGAVPGRCIDDQWRFLKTALDQWLGAPAPASPLVSTDGDIDADNDANIDAEPSSMLLDALFAADSPRDGDEPINR